MKRGKSSSSSSEEEDRISNLPESLIHYILSFIDVKFAVQTSVLSKKWRYIWTSLPVLDFCDGAHYGESDDYDEEQPQATKRFVKFVNKVLNRRADSDIQRLHLNCCIFHTTVSKIYPWITAAVRHNVQELYIRINPEHGFEIPPCLCTCESLTKMELNLSGWDDCDYENKIILPAKMSLPRLKSLHLFLSDISFDDEKLTNRFFSSFPSLQSLTMEFRHHAFPDMNLYISLPKLEHFKFEYLLGYKTNGEVKLHAPSLLSFIFHDYVSISFTVENLSSLVTADIQMDVKSEDKMPENFDIRSEKKQFYAQRALKLLTGIYNAKFVTLNESFLKALGGAPDLLDTQPPEILNLQRLELRTILLKDCLCSIFFLLKSAPNIESISLQILQPWWYKPPYCDKVKFYTENIGDYWDAGLSLSCMICHLKFVEIKGLCGCVKELKFLEILLKHGTVLEKVVLTCYSTSQDSEREKRMKKFSEIVLTFPAASKRILILFKF